MRNGNGEDSGPLAAIHSDSGETEAVWHSNEFEAMEENENPQHM